jgi:leucyl-tRNA synthetase
VPLDVKELPLVLPDVESYEPTDNGESPLATMTDWVNTTCPKCGGKAIRETDTMPQWAGSSWYFLRYIDPHNDNALASEESIDYFMPIDWYNGGMEHTTLHLLYSRFWHKVLYDVGVVKTKEPYLKRTSHGMILGENGEKMSKSRGNVVNPDEIVVEYGADTLRMYEMFIGDFEKSVPWSMNGVKGCRRFLDKVFRLQDILVAGDNYTTDMEVLMHKTIKKVSNDFETLKYNTGISTMMELVNAFNKKGSINLKEYETFLILLNPVAPHLTEELWILAGLPGMLNQNNWPKYEEAKTIDDMIDMPVQINGKFRGTIKISRDSSLEEAKAAAFANSDILVNFEGKTIIKEIFVPGKIFNLVVK